MGCEIKSGQPLPVSPIPKPAPIIEPPELITKYVFVVFEAKEPKLSYIEPQYIGDRLSNEIASRYWEETGYCSDIKQIPEFTEDDGYMLIDNFKKELFSRPSEYYAEVIVKVRNAETREALKNEKVEITSSKYLAFDSYKEASIERENIMKHGK